MNTAPSVSTPSPTAPSIPTLGRWLRSWVQPDGAIHGFHNHSVWGDNPFRYGDFTSGHSTFASPLLLALAHSLRQRPDPLGSELLKHLLQYQVSSLQPDGQFAHIGFQCGETLKFGLIHNVVPCAVLSAVAGLTGIESEAIDRAVRGVFAACDRIYGSGPDDGTCCNQEYCRLWARMLHMETFHHCEWHESVAAALDTMIERFHIRGYPDPESAGALRSQSNTNTLEPSEYYGLIILPLLLGHQRYGKREYLDEALAIARHCVRSSWIDAQGQRRAHRLWTNLSGEWLPLREPMLIGGFGLTLHAIQRLIEIQPDAELAQFLDATDATYAYYQHPAGFFLSATGWGCEPDIIPSSAWQSHDLLHLVTRHGVASDFWDTVFTPDPRAAVVFGQSMIWLEAGPHWAVRGYQPNADGLELIGRKDRAHFGRDIASWIGSNREMPTEYQMPDQPRFLRNGNAIHHIGGRPDFDAISAPPPPAR